MKKCIVIPDSFKGTMTSAEVCGIIEEGIRGRMPDCRVISVPIADGGEGTVDCFLAAVPGKKVFLQVKNAFHQDIIGYYGRMGQTAVIEMAAAAGMVSNARRDPLTASTYGVGQMIRHAVRQGCKKVIIGLGGSCTNDGGAGMAAALGTRFLDGSGRSFIPAGGSLSLVRTIDNSAPKKLLRGVEISCMCDIDNPMYGTQGAAYVFAPQKGADMEQVRLLDENLRAFARIIEAQLEMDVSRIPGGGAAGAMGAGAYAFLGGCLRPGIDVVLDLIGFDQLLQDCDCVFTGEGKLDAQTLGGKAVAGIGRRAKAQGVPVIAIVGVLEGKLDEIRQAGITAVYPASDPAKSLDQIRESCRDDLRRTVRQVLQDWEQAPLVSPIEAC